MSFLNFDSRKNTLFSALNLLSFALIILVFIQTYRKAFRPIGFDLTCYLISAEDFFKGKNPYTIDSVFLFIYPQFFDIIMYPLTFIPYWLAVFLWIVIAFISLFFTLKILLKILDPNHSGQKTVLSYFSAIMVLMFATLQDNFLNGQVNILLLFLCTLFLKFFLEKKIFLASLFLALSISIKITPAILLFFLLFHRDFKALFLTSLLTFVFVFGLPYIITGTKSLEYYQYYLDTFILHKTTKENPMAGFSLTHILGYISPQFALFISAFILITLNFLNQKYSALENTAVKKTVLFSLFLISTLLISPMSEGHHLIFMLPAYLFILNLLTKKPKQILLIIFIIITLIPLAFKKIDWLVFPTLVLLYFTVSRLNVSYQKR